MIGKILGRKFQLPKAFKTLNEIINQGSVSQIIIIKKIIFGVVILIFINSIIIGLLMGADSRFSEIISTFLEYVNFLTLYKIIFAFFLLILLTSIKLTWKQEQVIKNEQTEKQIDSIISGIVLSGTLLTYLLFIYVQLESILASYLPINFSDVVGLVKNGFWQLFFVSIINIIFFFIYYKKTSNLVQKILIAFIFASIILLISAGNRMFMYVINYGLSCEKFMASYTVIYIGILFAIMISILFLKAKLDILKTGIILALWMYCLLNILPTELFIFNANLFIANKIDTRMDQRQSQILSIDIYSGVEKLKGLDIYKTQNWDLWVENRLSEITNKKWYEKNIHNFY